MLDELNCKHCDGLIYTKMDFCIYIYNKIQNKLKAVRTLIYATELGEVNKDIKEKQRQQYVVKEFKKSLRPATTGD